MATTYTRRTYTQSQRRKDAEKALDSHTAGKPEGYESPWLSRLDALLGEMLNRPAFSYDLASDPLYGQYRDQYTAQGQAAMEDTLAASAALTGGYGSSYGLTAGQQAYNGYLQQLNAMIPELYQLALDTYDRQGLQLQSRYGLLADRENLDYSRYRGSVDDWLQERNYLAGRYDAERQEDYTRFRDDVSDDQWQAAFDEDIRRFDFANKLGEFAPLASVGGDGGGYGSSGGKAAKAKEKEEKEQKKTGNSGTVKTSYPSRIVVPSHTKPGYYTHESY